jgi:hypothetical protein
MTFSVGTRVMYADLVGTVVGCYPDKLCLVKFDTGQTVMLHEDSLVALPVSPVRGVQGNN